MAVNLSYRETQLVKRFRELDEHGKQLLEAICQAEIDIPSSATVDRRVQLAPVSTVEHIDPKRRAETGRLLELLNEINDSGIAQFSGRAEYCATKYPRYPKEPTVETKGLRPVVVEICRLIELMSDKGFDELIRRAVEMRIEFPRLPKKSAVVFSLVDGR